MQCAENDAGLLPLDLKHGRRGAKVGQHRFGFMAFHIEATRGVEHKI